MTVWIYSNPGLWWLQPEVRVEWSRFTGKGAAPIPPPSLPFTTYLLRLCQNAVVGQRCVAVWNVVLTVGLGRAGVVHDEELLDVALSAPKTHTHTHTSLNEWNHMISTWGDITGLLPLLTKCHRLDRWHVIIMCLPGPDLWLHPCLVRSKWLNKLFLFFFILFFFLIPVAPHLIASRTWIPKRRQHIKLADRPAFFLGFCSILYFYTGEGNLGQTWAAAGQS